MVNVLPHQGATWLEVAIVVFFGALFGWISIGFWTALLGFSTLAARPRPLRDHERSTSRRARRPPSGRRAGDAAPRSSCRSATSRSIASSPASGPSTARSSAPAPLDRFHFFVLSDTSDPDAMVREEEAWSTWCREVGRLRPHLLPAGGRSGIERKSGNVADFCRRWGARYRYMIMLDADSVMSGDTLVRLGRADGPASRRRHDPDRRRRR